MAVLFECQLVAPLWCPMASVNLEPEVGPGGELWGSCLCPWACLLQPPMLGQILHCRKAPGSRGRDFLAELGLLRVCFCAVAHKRHSSQQQVRIGSSITVCLE